MLGRKLGYRLSVLLENAVGLDDERHAGLTVGGIEGPSNIISISHVEEQGSQPERSRGRSSRPALAGTFVVARTQASPGAQMCSGGEPAHVGANLRQDDLGAQFTDPWDST